MTQMQPGMSIMKTVCFLGQICIYPDFVAPCSVLYRNISLQACMHKLSVDPTARGSQWPEKWPLRVEKAPYWLNKSQLGVYGKPAPEDFEADYEHWKRVVSKSYLNGMGIDWSKVRNVMDMRSVYGG